MELSLSQYTTVGRKTTQIIRGVSLLCNLEKMSAHILHERLKQWTGENGKIVQQQSVFRAVHSTVDNMFVLHAIVQRFF